LPKRVSKNIVSEFLFIFSQLIFISDFYSGKLVIRSEYHVIHLVWALPMLKHIRQYEMNFFRCTFILKTAISMKSGRKQEEIITQSFVLSHFNHGFVEKSKVILPLILNYSINTSFKSAFKGCCTHSVSFICHFCRFGFRLRWIVIHNRFLFTFSGVFERVFVDFLMVS
jgi:hypothetical protein